MNKQKELFWVYCLIATLAIMVINQMKINQEEREFIADLEQRLKAPIEAEIEEEVYKFTQEEVKTMQKLDKLSMVDNTWLTVNSTAYCLTGTMASGKQVYDGAVAMNGVALGTEVYVPSLDRTFIVEDRIGHSSSFDIWMSNCNEALNWGRRNLEIVISK